MNQRRLTFSRELVGDNVDEIVADGIEAEQLGFDIVWVPDHLVDIRPLQAITDTWTTLAYIGAKTQKIRLGSGVTDIQRIHPAKIANIVATLDNLTKGRAILGIGTGEMMNTKPYGIPWEEKKVRIRRLREILQVIKLLWAASYDHPENFVGEFYSLNDAHLSLPPVQKSGPPIYIGAFSAREMLRLVGEIADGWYPGSQNTLEVYEEKVRIIKDVARKSNRSTDKINFIASVPTIICDDEKSKLERMGEIKQALKVNLILSQYLLGTIGITEEELGQKLPKELDYQFAAPGPAYEKALATAVEKLSIPDEVLRKAVDKLIAIGTVDECLSTIEKFVRGGATQIFFANFAASRENYRRIGKDIISRLSQD